MFHVPSPSTLCKSHRCIQDCRSRGEHMVEGRHPDQEVPLLDGKTYQVGAKTYRGGVITRILGKGGETNFQGSAIELSGDAGGRSESTPFPSPDPAMVQDPYPVSRITLSIRLPCCCYPQPRPTGDSGHVTWVAQGQARERNKCWRISYHARMSLVYSRAHVEMLTLKEALMIYGRHPTTERS